MSFLLHTSRFSTGHTSRIVYRKKPHKLCLIIMLPRSSFILYYFDTSKHSAIISFVCPSTHCLQNISQNGYGGIQKKEQNQPRCFEKWGGGAKISYAWAKRWGVFAPKFGTRLIRLTPPVRPVFLNGLTGGLVISLVFTCIQNVEFQKLELKWSARKSNKIVSLLLSPKFLDLILSSTIPLGFKPC
jgi:hypothetical protein